jgi:hypothetical protein
MKKRKNNFLFLLIIIFIITLGVLLISNIFLKNIFIDKKINAKVVQYNNEEKNIVDNIKDFFSLKWLFGEVSIQDNISIQSKCDMTKLNAIISGLKGLESTAISPLENGGDCYAGRCSGDGTWWGALEDPYKEEHFVSFPVSVGCSGYIDINLSVKYETEDCYNSYASIQGCFGSNSSCDSICQRCEGMMWERNCSSCVKGSPDCYCSDGSGWKNLYSANTHPCYQYNSGCACVIHNNTANIKIPLNLFKEGDILNFRIGAGGGIWQQTYQGIRTGDLFNGAGNGNNIKITNVQFVPGPGVCGDENINSKGPDGIVGTDDDETCDPGMHCADGNLCNNFGECSDGSCAVRETKDCWSNCKIKECGDKFVNLNGSDGIVGTDDDEECDPGKFCADNVTDCTNSISKCKGIGDETCTTINTNNCWSNCKIKECGDKIIDDKGPDGVLDTGDDETCDPGKFCADIKTSCKSNSICKDQQGDQDCKTRVTKNCSADCKPICKNIKKGETPWRDAGVPGANLDFPTGDPQQLAKDHFSNKLIPDGIELIVSYNGCCPTDQVRENIINNLYKKITTYNNLYSGANKKTIKFYSLDTSLNKNLDFINSLVSLKDVNTPNPCLKGSVFNNAQEKARKLSPLGNPGGTRSNGCEISIMFFSNIMGNIFSTSLSPHVNTGFPPIDSKVNDGIDIANNFKGNSIINTFNRPLGLLSASEKLAKQCFKSQNNPSTQSGTSIFVVREQTQDNFSIDGIAYAITPHVNFNADATLTMNYSYYPNLTNPETYKEEDHDLIFSSCNSTLISTFSKNIGGTETTSISLNDEIVLDIPAGALDDEVNMTITKYNLTDCFLGDIIFESCGDGTCNNSETCSSCLEDCGECMGIIDTGGNSGSSSGGGGSSGSAPIKNINNTNKTNKANFTSVRNPVNKNIVNLNQNEEKPLNLIDKITNNNNNNMPFLVGLVVVILIVALIALFFLNINKNISRKNYKK